MPIQAYSELGDRELCEWERLLRQPDLQEQPVRRAAFRRAVTKMKHHVFGWPMDSGNKPAT